MDAYPQRDGGDWNRKAGSARIPDGYTLRLCTEPGGTGRCSDLTGAVPRLNDVYVGNDAAAWAEVIRGSTRPALPCPVVFEHDGFGGRSLQVCDDLPDLRGGPWNDVISSVVVPAGWALELCTDPHGGGACATFTGDLRALSSTGVGSDRASSIRVVRRGR